MQKLNPGYSFAKRMLEAKPDRHIGLIVNARGGSKIEEWLGKSKYYWSIRGRAKIPVAMPPSGLETDRCARPRPCGQPGWTGSRGPVDGRTQHREVHRQPLDHKGSRACTEEAREQMLANHKRYEGRICRMALIEPGDFATAEEAAEVLRRGKSDGAVAMGEHYGKGLMFDDPKNLLLYEASGMVDFPVMFHIDRNKNMVTLGMPEVDNVLKNPVKCE